MELALLRQVQILTLIAKDTFMENESDEYNGKPVVHTFCIAIVDTELEEIVYVDADYIHAADTYDDDFFPGKIEEWLEEHPGHEDAPDEVYEALSKRFVLVGCLCTVLSGVHIYCTPEQRVRMQQKKKAKKNPKKSE